jgi:hypothetical protein
VFLPDVQSAGAVEQSSASTADGPQAEGAAEHAVSAARPAFTGQAYDVLIYTRESAADKGALTNSRGSYLPILLL